MDNGGIWPGDESYFQNIRETALQDTIEQLTKEIAEARAEIENKQYSLVCDSERIQLLCEHVDELRAEIEHKGSLIEQMREALQDAIDWIEGDRFDDDYISEQWYHDGKAALEAAERGEV